MTQILDLLFPPKCEVCGSFCDTALCRECSQKITYLSPSIFIHSVGEYEGVLKKAIKRFKFNRSRRLAEPLGWLMAKYLNRHLWKNSLDLIIPVPLHKKRLAERGFNQSELLAFKITEICGIPAVAGLLLRKLDTPPQFNLPRQKRLYNVAGAFEVSGGELIKDKNILLVDDIYTTGATVAECTKTLKTAGAQSVCILTLSRAV